MLKSGILLSVFCSFIPFISYGQLPVTEVYVASFVEKDQELTLASLQLISDFNAGGYNNQARFFSDDQIYLSAKKTNEKTNDIVRLQLKTKELSWVTHTKEISEYSPAPCPDGKHFTTVRIEKNGKDQSLWRYPLDRSGVGERLFPGLNNIGYYAWINKDSVALFLVDQPNKLVIGRLSDGKLHEVARNPGRCLRYLEDGNLYFVQETDGGEKWLKAFHIQDQATASIIKMPDNTEDFEITQEGLIIAMEGSLLKTTHLNLKTDWKTIVDLSTYQIFKAQRPYLFRNQLLFVNNITESKR